VGGFLALSAAVCALQLVPLPAALLRLASPAAGELYDFALAPLGLAHPRGVTLDAAGTWRELAKHLAYLGAFVAAVEVSRSRRARRRLTSALAATGAVLALVGFGHRLAGATTLFGAVPFVYAPPPLVTPFANPNHLAGYLVLSATVCLGLALSASSRQGMWTWGIAYVLSGGALLLSLSRGGIGAFAGAQVLFVALSAWSRRRHPQGVRAPGFRRLLWGAVAVLVAGAVGLAVASDDILAELASADSVEKLSHSKLELWPSFAQAAWGYGRMGMGRGAFESGYTRFQDRAPELTFTHPENAAFQLADELGLPVTLLLLALFGGGFAQLFGARLRREVSSADVALWAGALFLLAHNLVDFNLEFSACAVALWTALGVLARPSSDEPPRRWTLPGGAAAGVCAASAALALLAVALGGSTLQGDERVLAERMATRANPSAVQAAALPLIDRHPADYALYGSVASVWAAARPYHPDMALAFVNRALFLRPIDANAHATAAEALLALGKRSQAFLEYRLALEASFSGGKWTYLMAGVAHARTAEELRAVVPDEPEWIAHACDQGFHRGLREEAERCIEGALADHGTQADAVPLWLTAASFRQLGGDMDGALERLAKAEALAPHEVSVALFKAELLSAGGQAQAAVAALEPLVSAHPASFEVAMALARAHVAEGRPRRAVDALERVKPFLHTREERTQLLLTEADAYGRDGRAIKQLEAYQSAARLQPANAVLHYNAAHVLEGLGRTGDALEEVRAGVRIEGPSAAQTQRPWMDALEKKKQERSDALKQKMLLQ
jgi:tetratricopeptide (TPR) repeat protein